MLLRFSVIAATTLAIAACSSSSETSDMAFMEKYWPGFDPALYENGLSPDCDGAPAEEKEECILRFYCDPAPQDRQSACRDDARIFLQ